MELPAGFSVAQPAVADAGVRVEAGRDGVWRCFCHKGIASDQEPPRDVVARFSVVDRENKIVGPDICRAPAGALQISLGMYLR